MKTLISFVIVMTLISFSLHAQTTRRVNNNDGVTGTNVYTTLQAAHDAASNGDIILVEPSDVGYGNLACTKNLKIYGNGNFLNYNGLNVKADWRESRLGSVEFGPGSAGSELAGFWMSGISIKGVSNIKISRNYCTAFNISTSYTSTIYNNVSNITITQNYSTSGVTIAGAIYNATTYKVTGVVVTNNHLNFIDNDYLTENTTVKYNTFNINPAFSLANTVFENNLIITTSTEVFDVVEPLSGRFTGSNSSINYNVNSASIFGAGIGTGNLNLVNITAEFADITTAVSPDANFKLKAGSSLKTAGSGGTEVGMYGGPTPYVLSGIPAIPSISSIKTTGTGSNTVPITVTFSAKSNN